MLVEDGTIVRLLSLLTFTTPDYLKGSSGYGVWPTPRGKTIILEPIKKQSRR